MKNQEQQTLNDSYPMSHFKSISYIHEEKKGKKTFSKHKVLIIALVRNPRSF
jgi:hypothetical protein